MTEPPDARQHPRFAVQIEAELQPPSGEPMSAITKDMSRGGICLACPREVAAGATVGLSLSLVLGTNSFSESLNLPARVVWCTQIEGTYQIGAMFMGLDRERLGFLEMFLRFLQQEVLVAGTDAPPVPAGPNEFDIGDADKP